MKRTKATHLTESEYSEIVEKFPQSKSKFKQQRVSACRPFMNPFIAAIICLLIGVCSLLLGLIYRYSFENTDEYSINYGELCKGETRCTIPITIEEDMQAPVFIYYELTNFYQNHFLFMKSRSDDQLFGKPYEDANSVHTCDPMIDNGTTSYPAGILVPCGALPNAVFNDTFSFPDEFPYVNESDITFASIRELYKRPDSTYDSGYHWLDKKFPGGQTNEHFINWVRAAAFSKFRKLWGRIPTDNVKKGTYNITISNEYNVNNFKGEKHLVIAEISWIGGKNDFFYLFFLSASGITILCAIVFAVMYFCKISPLYKAVTRTTDPFLLSLLDEPPMTA